MTRTSPQAKLLLLFVGSSPAMPSKKARHPAAHIIVVLLAWLVPGAGHLCVRRFVRGAIIFVTVSATFWAGVAVGGVMTVDHEQERWWFAAEMLGGAHGLAGWYRHQSVIKRLATEHEEIDSPFAGGDRQTRLDKVLAQEKLALVSPVATVARAYAGVAGLLNLMCIFDALMLSMMGVSGEPKGEAADDAAEGGPRR